MHNFIKLFLLISVTLMSLNIKAVTVVVHPKNDVALNKSDIVDIFLGKKREFKSGVSVTPLSLNEDSETTGYFVKNVLGKTPAQLKSYWARIIFTGQGEPPLVVENEEKMVEIISSNPNAIGFVNGKAPEGVRVIAEF